MKKLFLVVVVVAFFQSCTNSTQEKTSADSTAIDTLGVLFKNESLPLVLDTNTLYKIEELDSLGSDVIRALAKNIDTAELTNESLYALTTFYKIDSIKRVGKYKQFVDSLDIGQAQNVTAHALYKIKTDSNTVVYLWGLHYESYPACPGTTSNSVFISVMRNDKITETFCVGSVFWFADAPNIASEWTYTIIDKNKNVFINSTQTVYDIDDSLPEEITRGKYVKHGF